MRVYLFLITTNSSSLFISLHQNRCRKFGIIRWPHRKLHSLLEMYKSLAGYYQVKIDFDFSFYY